MKILVLTVSDRASRGEYEDQSGPAVESVLAEHFPDAHVQRLIVSDDKTDIENGLRAGLNFDFVLSTGGTGISERDRTPEVTQSFCDRLVPGIAETLRAESYKETPHAMLSRAVAGMKGNTLIVNMPGSVKGAAFCTRLLVPILKHAPNMARGKGH